MKLFCFFFFFQAEDGIRDDLVTGVQTCALPISTGSTSAGAGAGASARCSVALTSAGGAGGAVGAGAGDGATATCAGGATCRSLTCLTSTAPAVTITAAATPAAALEASVETPADTAPPAVKPPAAVIATPAMPPLPAATPPPPAATPAAPAPPKPAFASHSFLKKISGPSGYTAASARVVLRSSTRKVRQRSQVLRWRRTGAVVRASPSATWPSSSLTSSQVRSRASAASASDTRARTRSDLIDGTVVSIASAICSYDSASISRRSSAVRWVSGSSPTSDTIWRNSSRLCTASDVLWPWPL